MITDDEKDNGIKISVSIDGGREREIEAFGSEIYIGSGEDNNIRLCDSRRTVSRRHIRLIIMDRRIYVEDLGSKNGTYIGDRHTRVPEGKKIRINIDDVIYLGPNVRIRGVAVKKRPVEYQGMKMGATAVSAIKEITGGVSKKHKELEIPTGRAVIVGRADDCDIKIDHPQVSRHHTRLTVQLDGILIEDLGSKNGTFVNGRRVSGYLLQEGDILGIGPLTLSVSPKMGTIIEERAPGEGIRLDARGITRVLHNRKCILQPTYLSVLGGEFIGILGASGSGKTTLLSLINGSVIPTDGYVWLNGLEMLSNYYYLKQQVGYVPQHDIIHSELTVGEILYYTAKLRLPEDHTYDEIEGIIERTLGMVGLTEKWDTNFKDLSGGEQKRVNMAVELVTDPQIFFLDEPTSGLDPGMERDVMELFERYSHKERKTVVMVTHVTQNVSMMDKLIILERGEERGGTSAFFGTPTEALNFFDVGDFVEIYQKIEKSEQRFWSIKYNDSSLFKKYGYIYQSVQEESEIETEKIVREEKGIFRRLGDWVRQLSLLTSRYSKIMVKDTRNILTLLLQAPVIALLTYLVFKNMGNLGPFQAETMKNGLLFVLILSAIWFGANNSAREISKEQSVYRRERMVFLKICPYILSKFIVLSLICLFQTIMLVMIIYGTIGLKGDIVNIMLIVFLTALSGVTLGLFISSFVKTTNMAISLIPIILIPQIIFSGLIVKEKDMDIISKGISKVCVSYWSFKSIKEITYGELKEEYPDARLYMPTQNLNYQMVDKDKMKIPDKEKVESSLREEPTYKNFNHHLYIIGVFIIVPFILSYISLFSKERGGLENR